MGRSAQLLNHLSREKQNGEKSFESEILVLLLFNCWKIYKARKKEIKRGNEWAKLICPVFFQSEEGLSIKYQNPIEKS